MLNAFFEFYTSWFLIPAIFAAILIGYMYGMHKMDTKWATLFALFISVWAALLIEVWKRKEH